MSVNEIRNFIFENYYKRIGFSLESSYYSVNLLKKKKDLLLLATKSTEKIPDSYNTKSLSTNYKKEKHKISKTIKSNYSATKHF